MKLRRRRRAPDAPARWPRKWFTISAVHVAVVAVLIVAAIAASGSYSHMLEWAQHNGNSGANSWRAYLFPFSVDGAIIAATTVLYADTRAGREGDFLAYLTIAIGVLGSLVANILHTWVSTWAERGIAAWPVVALTISIELLLRFLRRIRAAAEERAEAEARRAERRERRVERRSVKVAQPQDEERAEAEAEADEEGAEVVRLRADDGHQPERPPWLVHGMSARDAMRAYLTLHPQANGAELDREVGKPFFGASEGYGRQIVRKWKAEQEEVDDGGEASTTADAR